MKRPEYSTSKGFVQTAALPEETATYKPITHSQLIDLTLESIYQAGFVVQKESYTMAKEGAVANGKYTISSLADNEMQIQIAWQNSYDKTRTLKWAIGVHVFICGNGCVSGDMGSFKRKHMGSIQEFTPKSISEYIKTAGDVFVDMQKQREFMKQIETNKRVTAELVGRMYLEHEFITSTQLNIIKRELEHPTYNYGAPNSLWELYNFTTFAMKTTHPSDWMEDHIAAHEFFTTTASDFYENTAGIMVPTTVHDHTIPVESPFKQLDLFEDNAPQEFAEL